MSECTWMSSEKGSVCRFFSKGLNKPLHIKKSLSSLFLAQKNIKSQKHKTHFWDKKPRTHYYLVIRTMRHNFFFFLKRQKKRQNENNKILPITFLYIHHQSLMNIKRRIKVESLLLKKIKKRKAFTFKRNIISLIALFIQFF